MKNVADASLIDTSVLKRQNGASPDPHSNTGSDSQISTEGLGITARVDYVTLLWSGETDSRFDAELYRIFGVAFDYVNPVPRKIGVYWDSTYSTPSGTLLCSRFDAVGGVHHRLSIPGKVCASVKITSLQWFLRWACDHLCNLRASRIDLAIDDYDRTLDKQDIVNALDAKNYSGFRDADVIHNYRSKWGGWCIYLGSRLGEKMVRIYDKYAQSKGETNCIRWEAELKGDKADVAMRQFTDILASPCALEDWVIGVAVGQLEFVRKTDKNIGRCEKLPWWEEWLDKLAVTRIPVKAKRRVPAIVDKMAWIARQVSKSMAIIADAIGGDRMLAQVAEAVAISRQRYTRADELLLDDWRVSGWSAEDVEWVPLLSMA